MAAVYDCATGQTRPHTAEELAAIEAARQAEAARPLREPDSFSFTPRELIEALFTAMVQENVMTQAKALAVVTRARDLLKR